MNERLIQNLIWKDLAGRTHGYAGLVVPNCTVFSWESDLIHVSRKHLVTEYEIKISRSDFRADLKKIRHRILSLIKEYERGPSRFYYAVPRDLIEPNEIPEHAGLIYVYPVFQIVKTAPQLHALPLSEEQRQRLQFNMIARYWRERMKLDGEPEKVHKIIHTRRRSAAVAINGDESGLVATSADRISS